MSLVKGLIFDFSIYLAQQFVIEKSFHLISGLFQIATARSWVSLSMNIISFGQVVYICFYL